MRQARGQIYALTQLVETFAESLQADGKADAFLRLHEDDEGRGLTGAKLLDQAVIHGHVGSATIGVAAHELRVTEVGLVDPQAHARPQQDAERGDHTQPDVLIGALEVREPIEVDVLILIMTNDLTASRRGIYTIIRPAEDETRHPHRQVLIMVTQ